MLSFASVLPGVTVSLELDSDTRHWHETRLTAPEAGLKAWTQGRRNEAP